MSRCQFLATEAVAGPQIRTLSSGLREEEETDLETTTCSLSVPSQACPFLSALQPERRALTVDDPGHPPQPEQNQQAQSLELMLLEQDDDVEDERNHDDDRVQDFKLVVEELPTENKYFKENLYHKEGQDGDTYVVEHLEEARRHSESRSECP